jgi:hypothetical protein
MVGAGFGAYSIMGYVISNMKPDREVGFQVELNVTVLSAVFGESAAAIQEAIDFLCDTDKESRTPVEDGRRLVKVGQFAYRVVNGTLYASIRNEEARREQNRRAQEKFRNNRKPQSNPMKKMKPAPPAGEAAFVKAYANRDEKTCDQIVYDHLPTQEADEAVELERLRERDAQ